MTGSCRTVRCRSCCGVDFDYLSGCALVGSGRDLADDPSTASGYLGRLCRSAPALRGELGLAARSKGRHTMGIRCRVSGGLFLGSAFRRLHPGHDRRWVARRAGGGHCLSRPHSSTFRGDVPGHSHLRPSFPARCQNLRISGGLAGELVSPHRALGSIECSANTGGFCDHAVVAHTPWPRGQGVVK